MIAILAFSIWAQTRIASDFEIQQMERQVAESKDFLAQLSGHLNLGDLRMKRSENAIARAEYSKALEIASNERLTARRESDLREYALATSYAGLAQAKLGNAADAFALSEEALRYASDSPERWNTYANTMTELDKPEKAVSAARNAVAIASQGDNKLDLALYQYSLASSLIALNQNAEAEKLLSEIVATLRSDAFSALRHSIEQSESFEIYSTARGQQQTYITVLNRSQLRLGELYENRGEVERAREQYRNVLAARTDEPTALAAMARLASPDFYAAAFDANPFSLSLIRDYQKSAGVEQTLLSAPETTGGKVRLTLQLMQRNELIAARETLDQLMQQFPNSDTLQLLSREIDARRSGGSDLRALIAAFNNNTLTAAQRAELDRKTFTSEVVFDAGPPFETGKIQDIPFRFSEPMTFNGTFASAVPLRLTYRILGASQLNGADALLLEPVRLETPR